jgi:hypothetical protein
MAAAGWVNTEPGVYVRSAEIVNRDQFNWKTEPVQLNRFIQGFIQANLKSGANNTSEKNA